jgi:predicted dehydrogenase
MKQVLVRRGDVVVEEVPAPVVEPGTVLVRVHRSCVSAGTEVSGIKSSGRPLWQRALHQPKAAVRVLEMAAAQGVARTYSLLAGALGAGQPTGYSAAGTVEEVGAGVEDLRPGSRVACAGAQCAHHAQFVRIPRHLTVPIPDRLDSSPASTVALGAIALQAVRRGSPTLGETFAVIGLGALGQLVCQLLKVNGCRVIGADVDRQRVQLAKSLGADAGVDPEDGSPVERVARLTGGAGADAVVITASTPSHAVVATAFAMCRRKGRVVLVGDVGLHLNRADFYEKELDFLISTSYGPGRYDRRYEEQGLDYPLAYVRWTENRNMAEYLRLLAGGAVRVGPLVGAVYPIEEAPAAYAALLAGDAGRRPLLVLLSYPEGGTDRAPARIVVNPRAYGRGCDRLRVAVVGAGAFAKQTHLPNLQALHRLYRIRAIVSRTGHNAQAAARQFAARYATTDFQAVLDDPEVDAVLIVTRHDLHGPLALSALRAGKHVLVEKPLALTPAELDAVLQFYEARPGPPAPPVLLTGFNRRFSPHVRRIHELVQDRANPMVVNYRMNAGYLPPDNWVHRTEGGGRNLGEACHAYDLFVHLTASRAVHAAAHAVRARAASCPARDNFIASLTFADGSVATLTYTALGHPAHPKEQMEIFCDGKVLVLDDYRRTLVAGGWVAGVKTRRAEKGHREELETFAQAIRDGGPWPVPLWQQEQAARISFAVEQYLGPRPPADGAGEALP